MNKFVHLKARSAYSLAEGAIHVEQLPRLCKKFNMQSVALCDLSNMFGALEFSLACMKEKIQPIIGCTVNATFNDFLINNLTLIVKNEIGYKNLLKMISYGYLENPRDVKIRLEEVDGLIALIGSDPAFLPGIFKDNLYIEIQRYPNASLNESKLLEIALSKNIPIVATNDIYFETSDKHEAHDALLCIGQGVYVATENRKRVTKEHHFKSSEDMLRIFEDLPEAIENTVLISKRCWFAPISKKPMLPVFCDDEESLLRTEAKNGLSLRLVGDITKEYEDRLEFEISVIKQMGFSGYFLIVSDFIKFAKSKSIPVGPGRGSGAGSLVAWSLMITDLDPIKFGLIFERFLNPERVSMPDFDIDFCQDRRDEVIDYVCSKYGFDRVAHIITFGKLQARAVIRDVGRVLQIPYGQVDRLSKFIPNHPGKVVTISESLELEPALRNARKEDELVDKLIKIAMVLEGLYRHASTHAAGVVISDKPLTDLIPLYKDPDSKLAATQFNMKYTELAGLVKFDFLGLKTLTIIEDVCKQIRKNYIQNFNILDIPLNDEKTFELLCKVEVVGVFQLESAGMKDVLKKLKPDRLEDLIALVALYRPGPMDDIPKYLACKHGMENITYLHPSLKEILEPTYGVMVYQEQVMKIAQIIGGYSLGDADLLRRAMGKKIKSEMDAQREIFTIGATSNGLSLEVAEKLFAQMEKFAGYGFNKSHSAPYALLTYQTAYLKANYQKEFFASTMTYDQHNIEKLAIYKNDLRNIKLYPPDVNYSFPHFVVENDGIRYSLAALKNVGEQAMQHLVAEREKGKFKSLKDFFKRIDSKIINKRQLEYLIFAGAFDSIHSNRAEIYKNIDNLLSVQDFKQASLFSSLDDIVLDNCKDFEPLERLQKEFEAIGFFLSGHPLDPYKGILQETTPSSLIESFDASQFGLKLAGVILSITQKVSKASGKRYGYITLSDLFGTFDVYMFKENLDEVIDKFKEGSLVKIEANLKIDDSKAKEGMKRLSLVSISNLTPKHYKIYVDDNFDFKSFKNIIKEDENASISIVYKNVLIDIPGNFSCPLGLDIIGTIKMELF